MKNLNFFLKRKNKTKRKTLNFIDEEKIQIIDENQYQPQTIKKEIKIKKLIITSYHVLSF